jgi:hypothetical protein
MILSIIKYYSSHCKCIYASTYCDTTTTTTTLLFTHSPWPESASELYRPNDRHLSAKLVPTFADWDNYYY